MLFPRRAIAITLPLATFITGCWNTTAFESVEPYCSYYVPDTGFIVKSQEENRITTFDRHPDGPEAGRECRDAIADVFKRRIRKKLRKDAPDGMLEKFYEAMQVIIGYPLALPPGKTPTFFQSIPIPSFFIDCILFPSGKSKHECDFSGTVARAVKKPQADSLNEALFNYIYNRFRKVSYDASSDSEYLFASYKPVLRQITLHPRFWKTAEGDRVVFDSTGNALHINSPLFRARSLIHEAHHKEVGHDECASGVGPHCDPDLEGSIGSEIFLQSLLLHGDAQNILDGNPRMHSVYDLYFSAVETCQELYFIVDDKGMSATSKTYGLIPNDCATWNVEGFLAAEGVTDVFLSKNVKDDQSLSLPLRGFTLPAYKHIDRVDTSDSDNNDDAPDTEDDEEDE